MRYIIPTRLQPQAIGKNAGIFDTEETQAYRQAAKADLKAAQEKRIREAHAKFLKEKKR